MNLNRKLLIKMMKILNKIKNSNNQNNNIKNHNNNNNLKEQLQLILKY